MFSQQNLFGEILKTPKNPREVREVCCDSCYNAKEKKCECKCGGAYHGLGQLNKRASDALKKRLHKRNAAAIDSSYEYILPEEEAKHFRAQYDKNRAHCICDEDLSQERIVYYKPHSAGWTVKCEQVKVWLYVKCPNCGHDMSLHHMGVPR